MVISPFQNTPICWKILLCEQGTKLMEGFKCKLMEGTTLSKSLNQLKENLLCCPAPEVITFFSNLKHNLGLQIGSAKNKSTNQIAWDLRSFITSYTVMRCSINNDSKAHRTLYLMVPLIHVWALLIPYSFVYWVESLFGKPSRLKPGMKFKSCVASSRPPSPGISTTCSHSNITLIVVIATNDPAVDIET